MYTITSSESRKLNLFIVFAVLLNLTYSLLNREWYSAAQVVQGAVFLLVASYYFIFISKYEVNLPFLSLVLLLPFYFASQGVYFVNVVVFTALIELSRRVSVAKLTRLLFFYSFFFSVVSVTIFLLGGLGFYNYTIFDNQIVPGISRLLGPDGSPVSVSIVILAGLICYSVFLKRSPLNLLVATFLIVFLFWTGSRTIILSMVAACFLSFFRGKTFSFALMVLIMTPFIMTYFYMSGSASLFYLGFVEKVTSFRVVNWANALMFYWDSPLFYKFFGIGHLPVLEYAYLDESLFDGYYKYKFVTYTESGFLRVLVNYGLIFFMVFFSYILFMSRKLKRFRFRFLVSTIILAASLYDPVFSVQYFFLLLLLFIGVRERV